MVSSRLFPISLSAVHHPFLPVFSPASILFSLQGYRDEVLFRSWFLLPKDKRIRKERKTLQALFFKRALLRFILRRAVSSVGEEQMQEKLSNSPRLLTAFAPILEFKPQQRATSKLPHYRVLKFELIIRFLPTPSPVGTRKFFCTWKREITFKIYILPHAPQI